jgi:dipeptidyl aminopeptidase/acylaminoacyl peptidase
MRPGRAPTAAPVLVVQGTADRLVPSAVTETFVQQLCDTGTTVRLDLYPDVGHGAVIAAAMPDILTWVSDRAVRGTRELGVLIPPLGVR